MDQFIQPIIDPVARRFSYVRNLTKNFEELKAKATELCIKRDDIKDRLDQQKFQKAPTRECEHWLAKVGEIENKLKIIEQEYNAGKKWLKGWCPDLLSRLKLGERVVDMINNVTDTYEKSKFEGGFVVDLPLAKVEKQPCPTLTAQAAADRTLQKVKNFIEDKRTQKIGIWGMGGVGKTTVMQLLNNTLVSTTMFDVVIWVTVSKSWSIRKLQDEIAKRLSIEITEESDSGAARKLFQVLEGKKYLLLLDDVWEMVELYDIGIPNPSQDNGCKVILTTRILDVCRKMGTDVAIKVEKLSKEEAWEMFHLEVGEVVVVPTIKPLAEDIVKRCDGLPLALKVVGGVLRKQENVNFWSVFLSDLKSPTTSFDDAVDEIVFKPLKVSYDHLKDTNKKCFLYCGLYPEDEEIRKAELIWYWIAEGFLSGKLTLAEARVRGDVMLQALIDSSLLERGEGDEYVKVHDVIQDLVLRMTSPNGEESTYLVRAGANKSKELLEDKEWESATRISYMCNDQLHSLPKFPKCPKLLTLLLQRNRTLTVIPESFFNHMPYLRVLDLSYTSISSLPTSISNLVSLRALFLRKCYNLEALPSGIWELTNLKCLKFSSHNSRGEKKTVISSGMISRLSLLEELSIQGNWFCFLGDERVDNLQYFIQNSKCWRDGKLKKFFFLVGISSMHYEFVEIFRGQKRCLFYDSEGEGGARDGDGSNIIPPAIMEVLARSHAFYLRNHYGELKNLSYLDTRGLKICRVERCGAIETIMGSSGDGVEVPDAFPNLEILELIDLPNLKCIMEGLPMQPGKSFTSLMELRLISCRRIKVFSWGLIRQLHNLESIFISKCPELEEVISSGMISRLSLLEELSLERCGEIETIMGSSGDGVEVPDAFPKLKILHLSDLPNLNCIVEGLPMQPGKSFTSLMELRLKSCRRIKKVFSWGLIRQLHNLESIFISKCPELEEVISSGMISRLSLLEELSLERCGEIETIMGSSGDGVEVPDAFPKLKILHLSDLPNLNCIVEGLPMQPGKSFTSLMELRLISCRRIKKVFSWGLIRQLHNLESIFISNCPELEEVISMISRLSLLEELSLERCGETETIMGSSGDGVEVPDAFPKLKILHLSDLPNLNCIVEGLPMQPGKSFTRLMELRLISCRRIKKVFSWGLIRQLHNLESIFISKCPELEEVISVEGNDCEMHESREVLPKLRFVVCHDLQNFVSFFGGISLSWPSLIRVEFSNCPKLKRLPF